MPTRTSAALPPQDSRLAQDPRRRRGEIVSNQICRDIREQRRFDSLEELVAAIGDDVAQTRRAVRPG
jgi:hypothetical protein